MLRCIEENLMDSCALPLSESVTLFALTRIPHSLVVEGPSPAEVFYDVVDKICWSTSGHTVSAPKLVRMLRRLRRTLPESGEQVFAERNTMNYSTRSTGSTRIKPLKKMIVINAVQVVWKETHEWLAKCCRGREVMIGTKLLQRFDQPSLPNSGFDLDDCLNEVRRNNHEVTIFEKDRLRRIIHQNVDLAGDTFCGHDESSSNREWARKVTSEDGSENTLLPQAVRLPVSILNEMPDSIFQSLNFRS
jgi:hypothetical protein